jgi:RHS repeat-associated protein
VPVATPFKFAGGTGYQADADSGLMLLGARYYDPSVGRFITRDPVGHRGGLNLYRYCGNDPLNTTDALGLAPWLDRAKDWYMGGMGGVSSLADRMLGGVASTAGDTQGRYDAGQAGVVELGIAYIDLGVTVVGTAVGGAAAVGRRLLMAGLCFAAGTRILTRDGERPIELIRPGDEVLSADAQTGKQSYQDVVRTLVRQTDVLLCITTRDGLTVRATPEHPFWVQGKGFVEAKKLARSDLLK